MGINRNSRCNMSGRKIDDHSFWGGARPKGSVLPDGAKMRSISSVEGAGAVGRKYPDTEEDIHKDQEHAIHKVERDEIKPGYRY